MSAPAETASFGGKTVKIIVGMPPGVSVILIMFNRFHNHVADNLAAINEGGRFTPPFDKLDDEKKAAGWKKYDEDLFQTARLVTSGLYINVSWLSGTAWS